MQYTVESHLHPQKSPQLDLKLLQGIHIMLFYYYYIISKYLYNWIIDYTYFLRFLWLFFDKEEYWFQKFNSWNFCELFKGGKTYIFLNWTKMFGLFTLVFPKSGPIVIDENGRISKNKNSLASLNEWNHTKLFYNQILDYTDF